MARVSRHTSVQGAQAGLTSTTKGTLPSSWHGMAPLSSSGTPRMSASAMVPGPALVMTTSEAPIHSSMLLTKPLATRRHGHCRAARRDASAALRPHTTTICALGGSASASASEVGSRRPMPSPPPMSSTTEPCGASPSFWRSAGRGGSGAAKAGRMGRPCCTICALVRPTRRASAATSSVGTKQRSTPRWNHVGWQLVRSVTTVAKGGALRPLALARRASTRSCEARVRPRCLYAP